MSVKLVIPTGYMGSGSSAVTDLLSEIYNFNKIKDNFEFVFMHCPNGLFDLEDKLLFGNSALRSDEAIHSFERCIKDLYYKKKFWVGDYKSIFGSSFLELTDQFILSLVDFSFDDQFWYYQENPDNKMLIIKAFKKLVRILSNQKFPTKPCLKYSPMKLSYPTKEKFYLNAKIYLNGIFDILRNDDETLIMDQLVLPYNLHRINNYFEDDIRVIVVDRDPRDLFLLNKYYWSKKGIQVPYSFDVKEFCLQYKRLREICLNCDSKNVISIKFEDLVYNYEETKNLIFDFLNIKSDSHLKVNEYFDPNKSVLNTQVFKMNEQYRSESNYIENNLSEYLYDFPFHEHGSLNLDGIIM